MGDIVRGNKHGPPDTTNYSAVPQGSGGLELKGASEWVQRNTNHSSNLRQQTPSEPWGESELAGDIEVIS